MAELFARPYMLAGRKETEGELKDIYSPGENTPFESIYFANASTVKRAISTAVTAFQTTRKLSTHKRVEICRKVAAALDRDIDRIAEDLAREAGKPITLAKAEVTRASLTFRTAAEEASRVDGEVLNLDVTPDSEGVFGITRRFPIGPVAAITPFNFPLNLVAHKLAPAIAAGCPIVIKPASATPLSALNLGHLLVQSGWPPDAISVLPCSAEDATPLVEDDRFKLISFTGSAEVGWDIKNRAGKKRVVLELGGNAAAVVDESADLDYAAQRCVIGGFAYAGQSCISVQRIFVHWNIKRKFLRLMLEEINRLKLGDIMAPDVLVGPMINEDEAIRVEEWVKEAVEQGAHILTGGNRKGAAYFPTLLTRVKPSMRVSSSEIFGPVVVVDSFDNWQEALDKVNDSDFGLQASVFTQDFERIMHAYEDINVGGLVINDMPTYRIDPQPYGGSKDSGTGREGPRYSIESMTEKKLLLIRRR